MLSKEDILGALDLSAITVEVPEWGGEVKMAPMTGYERDTIDTDVANDKMATINLRARVVGYCIVDDDGNRVFNNNELAALGKKSSKVLNRLFEIARNLCGMTEEDVKELEGNSESATSDDSGSSSP